MKSCVDLLPARAGMAALLLAAPSLWAEQPPARIMPLGDSITQGYSDSYRRPLWNALVASGRRVDFVGTMDRSYGGELGDYDTDHEGHWGWRADEVLEHIDAWARRTAPDIVLIHLGTNDIGGGQSIMETVREIEQIIDRLRLQNPQVDILLASIIPVADASAVPQFHRFNAGLAALAQRLDTAASRVILVDQASGFDAVRDTYDGIHPNERGNRKMAAKWLSALEPLLDDH